jgi:hypothetical protein
MASMNLKLISEMENMSRSKSEIFAEGSVEKMRGDVKHLTYLLGCQC